MSSPRPALDDTTAAVVRTEAELACLSTLRELVGAPAGPIERHSLRVFLIAEELARRAGTPVDREVLLCSALLHDAGLYPGAATHAAYVTDSRHLLERVLAPFAWPAERVRLCGEAAERHHELTAQWAAGAEVELLRRADLVEVSQTLVRFGLDRAWLSDLHARVDRSGFRREVGRLIARHVRERPAALWRIARPA